ncbi:hypothetical protein CLOM_g5013 [Closterium sp. NIES-68]|nr:hypothetical protein CLOM_g5013 [Closterium sp. NIES-68]GJP67808.1 hypothetical protein CLOP_g24578 [Closterium sp. NIES-67]
MSSLMTWTASLSGKQRKPIFRSQLQSTSSSLPRICQNPSEDSITLKRASQERIGKMWFWRNCHCSASSRYKHLRAKAAAAAAAAARAARTRAW